MRGTSKDLERPYLRLHFVPEASTVRPPEVLVQALALVKKKWVTNADYKHASEQLMAYKGDANNKPQNAAGMVVPHSVCCSANQGRLG